MSRLAARLVIPQNLSRVAVLGVLLGGVGCTAWFTVNRNVGDHTVRLLRDKDGVMRWMTRVEYLTDRAQVRA
jgi:hypothetical protein